MKKEETPLLPFPDRDTLPFSTPAEAPAFDGETYEAEFDHERLGAQALAVWNVMSDGQWRTLRQISDESGAPEASVSARIRDFRKPQFGKHQMDRRRDESGLHEYRLYRGETS